MPAHSPPVVARTQPILIGLPPVHDRRARLLVLGSFPGVASLQARQYYAHPRNQVWPVLSALTGEDLVTLPYRQRLIRVRAHGIAIWDVIGECFRRGSLDGAIRDPVGQDFDAFLKQLPQLQAVAFNGSLAARGEPWFRSRGYRTWPLPSTSPAHAAMSAAQKLAAWQVLATELRPAADPPGSSGTDPAS